MRDAGGEGELGSLLELIRENMEKSVK